MRDDSRSTAADYQQLVYGFQSAGHTDVQHITLHNAVALLEGPGHVAGVEGAGLVPWAGNPPDAYFGFLPARS